jgi:hypothetical protein
MKNKEEEKEEKEAFQITKLFLFLFSPISTPPILKSHNFLVFYSF